MLVENILFYSDHYVLVLIIQEEQRARDLFYALWVPDLFMERVRSNGDWSLFCPNEAPGLADCWGEEYENLYTQYEKAVSLVLLSRVDWIFKQGFC